MPNRPVDDIISIKASNRNSSTFRLVQIVARFHQVPLRQATYLTKLLHSATIQLVILVCLRWLMIMNFGVTVRLTTQTRRTFWYFNL